MSDSNKAEDNEEQRCMIVCTQWLFPPSEGCGTNLNVRLGSEALIQCY